MPGRLPGRRPGPAGSPPRRLGPPAKSAGTGRARAAGSAGGQGDSGSGVPAVWAARRGLVAAHDAGADGGVQVRPGDRCGVGNAGDRRAEGAGHIHPGSFGVGGRTARAPGEPGCPAQLTGQRLPFGMNSFGGAAVSGAVSGGELTVQPADPATIGIAGRVVQQRPGVRGGQPWPAGREVEGRDVAARGDRTICSLLVYASWLQTRRRPVMTTFRSPASVLTVAPDLLAAIAAWDQAAWSLAARARGRWQRTTRHNGRGAATAERLRDHRGTGTAGARG